eukprot:TRINITY_DN2888_c0_g1_i1.p1 TRINITY_DN2888_c0_g1~~TRINITY_DN2888_c0_g1_i1.p1  ORF type:complete len:1156 (-),score=266.57 TRINITY_DN2888_c0_g1_i1:100-3441(-)
MEVQIQQILSCLQNTLNPLADQRRAAESQLRQFEPNPGYIVLLFQIVGTNDFDISLRQAAVIYLKNLINARWENEAPAPTNPSTSIYFPQQDKEFIKEHIIDALTQSNIKRIKVQLASIISSIAKIDFPVKWPNFIPKIITLISTQSVPLIQGACTCVLMAFKKYEFMNTTGERSKSMHQICPQIFPLLLQVLLHFGPMTDVDSGNIVKTICKIFYSTTHSGVPPYFLEGSIHDWLNISIQLLERADTNANNNNIDDDMRNDDPWWKAKKWLAHVYDRFILKYSRKTRSDDTEAYKQFKKIYLENGYAVRFINTFLNFLNIKRTGQFLPDRILQISLSYICSCIPYGITFPHIVPHLNIILQEVIFPLLCITPKDEELWSDDPLQYIKQEFDPVLEYYNPRTGASNFLIDLVQYRGIARLNSFMNFIVSNILVPYMSSPPEQRNYFQKDGALAAIGILAQFLKSVPDYKANLESMLIVHVFSEFSSPHKFLRARACWVFSQFPNAPFKQPQSFMNGLKAVVSLMRDPELPVRIQAALAIRPLIMVKNAKEEIRPILPSILDQCFQMMNEIDNDDLVQTLESIIFCYGEEMSPYAATLCAKITEVFLRCVEKSGIHSSEDGDIIANGYQKVGGSHAFDDFQPGTNDDSAAMAALQCLTAVLALLKALKKMPQAYAPLEPLLLPILKRGLQHDTLEYLQEILKIITFITYFQKSISPLMWELFPLMYTAFTEFAPDFIEHFLSPFDNYISFGTSVFLSPGTPLSYVDMTCEIFRSIITDPKSSALDSGDAIKLMECVLQNCRGQVDRIIPPLIELVTNRLETCKSGGLRVLLFTLIANCLYYNPALTLHVLESRALTGRVFTLWINNLKSFRRFCDRKVSVLGLSSIFDMPFSSLPESIQKGSKIIVSQLIQYLISIYKEEALDVEGGEDEEEGEDYNSDEFEEPFEEEEEEGEEYEMFTVADDQDVDDYEAEVDRDVDELAEMAARVSGILSGKTSLIDVISDEEGENEENDNGKGKGKGKKETAIEYEGDEEPEEFPASELEEEDQFSSPLDDVDEFVFFATKMQALSVQGPSIFEGIYSQLSASEQESWKVIITRSHGVTQEEQHSKKSDRK